MAKESDEQNSSLLVRLIFSTLVAGVFLFSSLLLSGYQQRQEKKWARTPASEISLESYVHPDGAAQTDYERMLTLKLGCYNPDRPHRVINSFAKQLRISGSLCDDKLIIRNTVIQNISNHMQATHFLLDNNGFTTDYINLQEGENRILISHTLDDDTKIVSEIVVERMDFLARNNK